MSSHTLFVPRRPRNRHQDLTTLACMAACEIDAVKNGCPVPLDAVNDLISWLMDEVLLLNSRSSGLPFDTLTDWAIAVERGEEVAEKAIRDPKLLKETVESLGLITQWQLGRKVQILRETLVQAAESDYADIELMARASHLCLLLSKAARRREVFYETFG